MSYLDTRVLIFPTQAAALSAAVTISGAAGFATGTLLYDQPRSLSDGRWCLLYPPYDAWLTGVSDYTVADGLGLVAVGESGVRATLVECLALRNRFTDAELGGITVAASEALTQQQPQLQMLLDTMGAAVQLDLTDPRVQQGFSALVAAGLLTADRAAAILAPVGLTTP